MYAQENFSSPFPLLMIYGNMKGLDQNGPTVLQEQQKFQNGS